MSDLTVTELVSEQDVTRAFATLRQLRTHLDLDELHRRLAIQRTIGYRLWGALDGTEVVGVLGARIVTTLARGTHLHVDDLVVDAGVRGRGIGKHLMAFAQTHAEQHACAWIFLDSRPEVIDVYVALGYERHTATLMRKRL